MIVCRSSENDPGIWYLNLEFGAGEEGITVY